MRAVLLAAGRGFRLGARGLDTPKCLLRFGGESLLERHLRALARVGVREVHIGIGFHAEAVEAELQRVDHDLDVSTVYNPDYLEGNVVTLWTQREALRAGGPVLLMDADVLYDPRIMQRLMAAPADTCFLLDRDLEPGDEPVKLCVRDGRIVEFAKQVPADLGFDYHGESVGFFKLGGECARELAARCEAYLEAGKRAAFYEDVLRDMLLDGGGEGFAVEDITGLPWIEIDFPEDVQRAERVILPAIRDSKVPA